MLEGVLVGLWAMQTAATGWGFWRLRHQPAPVVPSVSVAPVQAVLVPPAAPVVETPKGARVVLLLKDRDPRHVVAEYRLSGRRPWRIMHDGVAFDCIEERDGIFWYAAS